jgi:hypothetical protein
VRHATRNQHILMSITVHVALENVFSYTNRIPKNLISSINF